MKKRLMPKQRPGVTLLELIIVVAISAAMVPLAFSVFNNRNKTEITASTDTLETNLVTSLNQAQSGVGPAPGMPLATGDLLFGDAVVFGNDSSFGGFSPISGLGRVYKTYTLSVRMTPIANVPGGVKLPGKVARYQVRQDVDLPANLGYKEYCIKGTGSCSPQSIMVVFYKTNLNQAVLPVQTRVFRGSNAIDFSPPSAPAACIDTRSDCLNGSSGYLGHDNNTYILRFSDLRDASITSCILITPQSNDIHAEQDATACN